MSKAKHPLAIRWFHWINFPILALMIWSGMLIYWANDVYRVGAGDFTVVKFFPTWFYETFNIGFRLAEGMAWHFFFMWFFALNGLLYVAYTIASGEWRYLVPNRRSFVEAVQVVLHDLHLSKYHPPQKKFNGAQQIAYTSIILMGAGSLLTGLAIYKPTQLGWLANLLGGYATARFEHFWLTMGYVAFFFVHIAQVIKAGWSNFRSMITGFEEATGHGRRSFLLAGASVAVGLGAFRWLNTRSENDGVLWPLRRILETNERIARDFFRSRRLAPSFPIESAIEPRENGDIGLEKEIALADWKLNVRGGRVEDLTLEAIKALPRTEMVTELKCIEGWSMPVHWAGARLDEFIAKYGPEGMTPYVSLETPDGSYYVGLEADSAMHPQTLLAYEMNGEPLTQGHGAPLRLAIPVKYGIKNIKRIGTIRFTDQRPADYWAERGYDWYAGH